MKILYVDNGGGGHHSAYLRAISNPENENIYILSGEDDSISGKKYIFSFQYGFNPFPYLAWLKRIRKIADAEQADVIHFVYADILYRFFGLGLGQFQKYTVVASFHRIEKKYRWYLSRTCIVRRVNALTTHVMGTENCVASKYRSKVRFVAIPSLLEGYHFSTEEARDYLGIQTSLPIVSVVGILAAYKSMDTLFGAITQLENSVYMLIAGFPDYYSEEYIKTEMETRGIVGKTILRFLTDEEFAACIAAADIVAVPYDNTFEGNSGPMTEAICNQKTVVGSDHSNIGEYIRRYHIGYACPARDVQGLANAFSQALSHPIQYTSEMDELIEQQTVESFRKSMGSLYQ